MMLCSRRCLSTPPLTLVAGILFFIIVMTKQVKDMYDRNQKYYRMQTYNEFMNDVSQSMSALEVTANKSTISLHRLTSVLQKQNALTKRLKNEKENS